MLCNRCYLLRSQSLFELMHMFVQQLLGGLAMGAKVCVGR